MGYSSVDPRPEDGKAWPVPGRTKGLVIYDGFKVSRESITSCAGQLRAIASLDSIEKQFIGALIDTEAAAGYFMAKRIDSRCSWTAYVSVKMKYAGDVGYFAGLLGSRPPSRTLNANTLTRTLDLRWSKQIQGLVAYALLKAVRQYLHNEKSIIEVDCILVHGPKLPAERPHPFEECGAIRIRRGVWRWPQIGD